MVSSLLGSMGLGAWTTPHIEELGLAIASSQQAGSRSGRRGVIELIQCGAGARQRSCRNKEQGSFLLCGFATQKADVVSL